MENLEFTIKKTQVECYKIRQETTIASWADITIDSPGIGSGRIMIASDYGDWQNYWGAVGGSFKEFLTRIDKHYVAGKFGANRWFDQKATVKFMKKQIIDYRRDNDIDCEKARDMWNDLKELEEYDDPQVFSIRAFDSEHLSYLFDCGPELFYDCTPGFNAFWEIVWPVFIDQLKQEISQQTKE